MNMMQKEFDAIRNENMKTLKEMKGMGGGGGFTQDNEKMIDLIKR